MAVKLREFLVIESRLHRYQRHTGQAWREGCSLGLQPLILGRSLHHQQLLWVPPKDVGYHSYMNQCSIHQSEMKLFKLVRTVLHNSHHGVVGFSTNEILLYLKLSQLIWKWRKFFHPKRNQTLISEFAKKILKLVAANQISRF